MGRDCTVLEVSILCVIALAAIYWAALWLMGRREDVLYGDFVKRAPPRPLPTPSLKTRSAPLHVPRSAPMISPAPSPIAPAPLPQLVPVQPALLPRPTTADLLQRAMDLAALSSAAPQSLPPVSFPPIVPTEDVVPVTQTLTSAPLGAPPSRDDMLASLLATIKRDLDDVART